MTLIEKTIEYEGVTIVCKRATVRSRLQTDFVYSHFINEHTAALDMYTYTVYARFLTQCTVTGDLGFAIPGIGAEATDMLAGLEAFLDQPAVFLDTLIAALNEVDRELPKKTLEVTSTIS